MGILSKLSIQSQNVVSRPAGRRSGGVTLRATPDTMKALEQLPWEFRDKLLKKAVADAAKIVVQDARSRLQRHESDKTGTAALWSKSVREKRQSRRWNLRQSIGQKVKVYQHSVAGFVGARYPFATHAHLLEMGGVFPRWGKVRTYQPPRPFLRPAGRETVSKQKEAMLRRVKTEWKNV